MTSRWMKSLALAAALGCAANGASAGADTLTFTLANPSQSVSMAGGTARFYATVSAPLANGGPEFLNGDETNISPGALFVDDEPFFADFPLFLAPGQSFSGLLFTLDVPAGTAGDVYLGDITLLGGPTDADYGQIGDQKFSITLAAPAAAVPEAATWAMTIVGAGAIGGSARRRRRASARVAFA